MSSKRKRILSIDGGGIRGLIPVLVLKRLEQLIAEVQGGDPKPLAHYFDLIAGTSTGAIIAVGLAGRDGHDQPLASAAQLETFYRGQAASVFRGRRLGLLGPKYIQEKLADRFAEICGNARLSDARPNLLVPAFELEHQQGFLFRGGPEYANERDYFLRDVLLASTAAPYLFPPALIAEIRDASNLKAFIDGGSFAGNPALHAYLDIQELFGKNTDMLLVSLGTGQNFQPIDYHLARRWGLLAWLSPRQRLPLVQMFLNGQSNDTDQTLTRIIPDPREYWRFDGATDLPLPPLDDASERALAALTAAADDHIARQHDRLAELAAHLVQLAA